MWFRLSALLVVTLVLAGCGGGGGGGGGGAQVETGVFIDSAVQNVRYQTPTRSGRTDAAGTFEYLAGETVSFFIGDILLGTANGAAQITPIDFVPGAADETHPTVTNILRFVQTLDEDNDTSNGIVIAAVVFNLAAGASIDFAQAIVDFENDGNVQTVVATLTAALGAARTLVDAATAQAHLRDSIGGGGGGGGGGSFGSLTVSGNDSGAIGTRFEPQFAVPGGTPTISVVWTAGMPGEARSLTLLFPNQPASSMNYIFGTPTETYSYQIVCFLDPPDCAGIVPDNAASTVTFTGVVAQPAMIPDNAATAPVTLNGTLSW